MSNLNVHLDDGYWEKFKNLKTLLKCNTNEETEEKIILLAQQQLLKDLSPNQQLNGKPTKPSGL